MKKSLVWLLAMVATPAFAESRCELSLKAPGLRLEECADAGVAELRLRLGGEEGFAVSAWFDPSVNDRMFKKIAPLASGRPLNREDQARLRETASQAGSDRLSQNARTLFKFLTEFAPPGFIPKVTDLSALAAKNRLQAFAGTTVICEKLGRRHTGYFTAKGQAWQQTMVLGSHGCMGKCGPGCGADGRWDQGQYTQECYNHDLCCTMTKDNMGDCEDEFWAAAAGFLSAPLCMFVQRKG
jgi:hypothetical protein